MAILYFVFVEFVFCVLTLEESNFSLQLGVLFLETGDNDARIYCLISHDVVFDEGHSHCELAS